MSLMSAVLGLSLFGSANATEMITIYYSPSCPYCHYARNDISDGLIYEYPNLSVTEIDVSKKENRGIFGYALKKCGFESGGVPVVVYGDKCEQGYSDILKDDLRKKLDAKLTEDEKTLVDANRKAMEEDLDAFKAKNADRKKAITQFVFKEPKAEEKTAEQTVEPVKAEDNAASVEEKPAEQTVEPVKAEDDAASVEEKSAEQTVEPVKAEDNAASVEEKPAEQTA